MIVTFVVASLAMLLTAIFVGLLFNFIFPLVKAEYENTHLFRRWDDSLMYIYFIQPFIMTFAFIWIWNRVKLMFSGSVMHRAFLFTVLYLLVCTVPGMIMSVSSFNISVLMTVTWMLTSFFQVWVAMLIIIKMNK